MFWFIYFDSALKQPRKLSGLIKSFLARNELVAADLRAFCGLGGETDPAGASQN
jgi:hypothetical protein